MTAETVLKINQPDFWFPMTVALEQDLYFQ